MSEYEFDAHLIVESDKTQQGAADEILETLIDTGIACSLHGAGTLNVRAKDKEIERLTAELEVWKPDFASHGHACPSCGRGYDLERKLQAKNAKLQAVVDAARPIAKKYTGFAGQVELIQALALLNNDQPKKENEA